MKKVIIILFFIFLLSIPGSVLAQSGIYYISPQGNDSNNGLSISTPFATFSKALSVIQPGQTILVMDGTYYQSIDPNTRGIPGSPITIRAMNDGKAIIDGEGVRIGINLWGYKNASWFVFEGLVFKNGNNIPDGSGRVPINGVLIQVESDNNIFRRISAYSSSPEANSTIFSISGNNNLVEDCITYGYGRKQLSIFKGNNNTVRRCFGYVLDWWGRDWGDSWPWTDGYQFYNSNDNLFENIFVYGTHNSLWGISFQANGTGSTAVNNRILGSAVIYTAMYPDGTKRTWGCTTKAEPCSASDRPQPTTYTNIRDFDWPSQRAGFNVHASNGLVDNNLIQDILAYGGAGLGFSVSTSANLGPSNILNRGTFINNGLNSHSPHDGGMGADALIEHLNGFTVTDTYVGILRNKQKITQPPMQNGGARLRYQYTNGILTANELWPFPMEQRGLDELGISITNLFVPILQQTNTYK